MSGFGNDTYIPKIVNDLLKEYQVKCIVETGTYKGDTTSLLAKYKLPVHTIEINEIYYEASGKNLKQFENVRRWKGSSPIMLNNILNHLPTPIFFFLDAHWYKYNPLLDELLAIAKFNLKNSIIAIHDFKVPEKDFGFDSYDGKDYDWEYIKGAVEKIYGKDNYRKFYNEQANGAYRGIIFITPK